MGVAKIEEAIADIRDGKMIILVDDEDRENEGDLTIAAEKVTPEAINFMLKYCRGLICLSLISDQLEKLKLPIMVRDNRSPFQTAFTVSITARKGVTKGMSARDRATTILAAVADEAKPEDLVRPGQIFPLRARRGGVLVRTGQTEGSVDLSRLAGLKPAGVICEIMKDDGTMARMPDLEIFAEKYGFKIATIADLVAYRMRTESFVHRAATTVLNTKYGRFNAVAYDNDIDDYQHVALYKGAISPDKDVLVRVHSECLTGDVFGSLRCDCGDQLHAALETIEREGSGVLLYIHQEGRLAASLMSWARLASSIT
ncbi:MAG: 3,4-dihydroxy-2-butanone-4-phosphate synthase [Deltaproteobacteria bacterium]|nr:3,4-dihydroxy-2-butanone-4-phosphate synthase [Deltaproteobacteria bacterium]